MRQAVAGGGRATCARRSTSSSTTPAARSSSTRGRALLQVPGERNELRYVPRGVAAVISPWNFPLAIPCGMTAAALATGNAVVLKPAEQSPGCALRLVRGAARGRRPAGGDLAAPRRGRRSARRSSATATCTRSRSRARCRSGSRSSAPPPRSAPGQHHIKRVDRRARRQELRDRRRRRRPRRGRPGDRLLGVRVRRPEVLGGVAGAGPRGDRRPADRAGRRRGPRARRRPGGRSSAPTCRR